MLSTVWITLNAMVVANDERKTTTEESETFMFGPTGVVRFKTVGECTVLMNSNSSPVATVTNSQEEIMNILRKMRGTEGKLDVKPSKTSKTSASKSTKSNRKATR